MRKLLVLLLTILCTNAIAETDTSGLYKVNLIIQPKCAEFYRYKDALYCSVIAHTLKPIDPAIVNYEKFHIVFDNRPWMYAWGNNQDFSFNLEYIPKDDTLELWHEMITSQFIPRAQAMMTPRQYFNREMESIINAGFQPVQTIMKETPDEVIAEFQVKPPAAVNQDEIQRIIKTDNGFYVLHYATRSGDMGAAERAKWLTNLKNSTIIDPYQ